MNEQRREERERRLLGRRDDKFLLQCRCECKPTGVGRCHFFFFSFSHFLFFYLGFSVPVSSNPTPLLFYKYMKQREEAEFSLLPHRPHDHHHLISADVFFCRAKTTKNFFCVRLRCDDHACEHKIKRNNFQTQSSISQSKPRQRSEESNCAYLSG